MATLARLRRLHLAPRLGLRAHAAQAEGGVLGPRHYPSLSQTLRNTRGRELLRIVDTAVPNLTHVREFGVVLRALAIDGQWRRALRLLREMREAGIVPNDLAYNEVLAAMAKDKQVERAIKMLGEMKEACLTPDLASYNHCISACKPAEWLRALDLLENFLPAAGLEPDGQTLEYTAAACEEGGQWQKSLTLFLEIEKRGLESTSVGHNYALSACRQGKQWRHGLEIMAAMKARDFEPDFRLKADLEAQSRGLDRAPPPEPSRRATPSPDNLWQRKQQLRELREQDKRRQEERKLEQERERKERERAGPAAAEQAKPAPKPEPKPEPQAKFEEVKPVVKEAPKPKPAPRREIGEHVGPPPVRPAEPRLEMPPRQRREQQQQQQARPKGAPRPKLRAPGSYVLPVFAQHDRSNHAERQALIKVISRVQEASGAQTDEEFEKECAEVTGTVRLYASHTPCISCMACFCQFQRLFPKVKLCVDFDDWRDTRRMVEMARREQEHRKRNTTPPDYDCPGLSDMSDEEEPPEDSVQRPEVAAAAA